MNNNTTSLSSDTEEDIFSDSSQCRVIYVADNSSEYEDTTNSSSESLNNSVDESNQSKEKNTENPTKKLKHVTPDNTKADIFNPLVESKEGRYNKTGGEEDISAFLEAFDKKFPHDVFEPEPETYPFFSPEDAADGKRNVPDDNEVVGQSDDNVPRFERWQAYVSIIARQSKNDCYRNMTERFNDAMFRRKQVIVITCCHYGSAVEKWILLGRIVEDIAAFACVCSLIVARLKMYPASLGLGAGGSVLQTLHSLIWDRDILSRYALQPLNGTIHNCCEEDPKPTVLVRKTCKAHFITKTALAISALSVSAWLFWKSMN